MYCFDNRIHFERFLFQPIHFVPYFAVYIKLIGILISVVRSFVCRWCMFSITHSTKFTALVILDTEGKIDPRMCLCVKGRKKREKSKEGEKNIRQDPTKNMVSNAALLVLVVNLI